MSDTPSRYNVPAGYQPFPARSMFPNYPSDPLCDCWHPESVHDKEGRRKCLKNGCPCWQYHEAMPRP